MLGEMTIMYSLADANGGTVVLVAYEGLLRGVSTVGNEIGARMLLANLVAAPENARASGQR
jgi:hypothetical protein